MDRGRTSGCRVHLPIWVGRASRSTLHRHKASCLYRVAECICVGEPHWSKNTRELTVLRAAIRPYHRDTHTRFTISSVCARACLILLVVVVVVVVVIAYVCSGPCRLAARPCPYGMRPRAGGTPMGRWRRQRRRHALGAMRAPVGIASGNGRSAGAGSGRRDNACHRGIGSYRRCL